MTARRLGRRTLRQARTSGCCNKHYFPPTALMKLNEAQWTTIWQWHACHSTCSLFKPGWWLYVIAHQKWEQRVNFSANYWPIQHKVASCTLCVCLSRNVSNAHRDGICVHKNHFDRYADASKTADNMVSTSCYIEPSDTDQEHKIVQSYIWYLLEKWQPFSWFCKRLSSLTVTDRLPLLATHTVCLLCQKWAFSKPSQNSSSKAKQQLNCDSTLVWIPSHIGIKRAWDSWQISKRRYKQWVSDQFLSGTSAHKRPFSA